jgi:hypothetical protein
MTCLIKEIALEQKLTAYTEFNPSEAEASISGYTRTGCYNCNGENTSCEFYLPKTRIETI